MPFTKPFKCTFSQHDLVYGLAAARDVFVYNLVISKGGNPDEAVIINDYAVTIMEKNLRNHGIEYKSSLSEEERFTNTIKEHTKYSKFIWSLCPRT